MSLGEAPWEGEVPMMILKSEHQLQRLLILHIRLA